MPRLKLRLAKHCRGEGIIAKLDFAEWQVTERERFARAATVRSTAFDRIVSGIVLAGVDISFRLLAREEATDLHALSGHVGESFGDKMFERCHDYVIKRDAFADEYGKHLVVGLAILDLLEEPDWIALDNGARRKGSPSQHEAVDTIAVATARADDETIRKRVWARDFDRALICQSALIVDVLAT